MPLEKLSLAKDLIDFIQKGTTPFHVVQEIESRLIKNKFIKLEEDRKWNLLPEHGYYLLRGGSIISFMVPASQKTQKHPYHIWGAHTDSPALKLRGRSQAFKKEGLENDPTDKVHFTSGELWGVEIYGSPILNTWLDRPLNIDGKIFLKNDRDEATLIKEVLWKGSHQAVISNVAIHLNRQVNKGFQLNRETQLQAIMPFSLIEEISYSLKINPEDILTWELFLNDSQPPKLIGRNNESPQTEDQHLIQSPKLDNLAMCHAGLVGLTEAIQNESSSENECFPLLALFHNEEVGSASHEGAASLFLKQILDRISFSLGESEEGKWQRLSKSMVISADMAHAYHPGFDHLYGKNHRSYLGEGIVLKRDSNLHYMNDSLLLASTIQLLKRNKIPFQEYFQHNDIPCGSTIGPHLSSHLGLRTLDLGTAILAMHSIRETGSIGDHLSISRFARHFFSTRMI